MSNCTLYDTLDFSEYKWKRVRRPIRAIPTNTWAPMDLDYSGGFSERNNSRYDFFYMYIYI